MNKHVDMFGTLFAGRTDAHGRWNGGKLYGPPDYEAHLHDGPYIGVYCVDDNNRCHWGCVDIDGKDFAIDIENCVWDWERMWETANNLTEALKYKNITAWTERTTNGIHIWTFPTEPVPATIMRRALLVACDVIDYQPKEVNPKQETLNPEKPYGNYVRLPYYGAVYEQPADRFVIDEDGQMWWQDFVEEAYENRTDPSRYKDVAEYYVPPVHHDVNVDVEATSKFKLLYPALPPVVQMIYEQGPLGDRSSALMKTAVILRDNGWQAQAAYDVLDNMDLRLGKFVGREDREMRLLQMIEEVY